MVSRTCIKCGIKHYAITIEKMRNHFYYKDKKTGRLSTICIECDKKIASEYKNRRKASMAPTPTTVKKCIVCGKEFTVLGNRVKNNCNSKECMKVEKRIRSRMDDKGPKRFKKKLDRLAKNGKELLRKKYTTEELNFILDELDNGNSIMYIAKKLKRSYWSVYNTLTKLRENKST